MTSLPPFVQPLSDGIHVVDTGFHRPGFDAAYLVVEDGRGAFVDTGTNHSVDRLLEALEAVGLRRDAVDYVIPTHVHLDHAGGVGRLMRHLPEARAVVHARGARHLIDPRQLMAGARAVYGDEEVARSYGELVPVEAARVVETTDGMELRLAGRSLVFIDTPGHARHHHGIWDARSRGFFSGDTFGVSYREFDTPAGAWILPTTTPVQFDPVALRTSVQRILSHEPEAIYLTHFGRVAPALPLARIFLEQLDEMVAFASSLLPGPSRHQALKSGLEEIHLRSLRRHGNTLPEDEIRDLLALDLELNAQGIGVWLDKQDPPSTRQDS